MKKIVGLLLAVFLVFSITIPTKSVFVHADSPIGYVTMSVDANTLGAGLIRQPVKVPFYEGDNYAKVIDRFLNGTSNYDSSGSVSSGFYLSRVKLENGNITVNVPTVIRDAMKLSNEEVIANGAQKAGYLGEFDYNSMSGWMYSVNNEFPNVGASNRVPKDGDVCRWQFTLYGYGSDLGQDNSSFGGDKALYTPANKDSLLKMVAEVNSAPNKEALLAKASIRTAYDHANTALSNLTIDQTAVNNALTTLNDALNNVDISTQLNASLGYILTKVPNPSFGTGSGEWSVLSLARGNYNVPDQYFVDYYNRIVDTVKSANGVLSTSKNTEYARLVLALSALGKDSTDVGGYNLLTPLADYDKTVNQGINGGIFALIALDSNNYQIPTIADSAKQATREKYVNYILSKEVKKGTDQAGGFALFGTTPDPDITSMALQALAPYQSMPEVKDAINRALTAISTIQKPDGGFTAFGSTSSESISQVIVALAAVGVNPATDSRFVKPNGNLVSALLRFYVDGGGFKHILTGNVDGMATDQGTYALVSYDRFLKGENSLYKMTDAPVTLVANQIKALPVTITISNEQEIVKARTTYDGLTAAQQGLLSSAVLDKLVAAEAEINRLKDEALVDSVINKINDLPTTISLSDETAVVSAREAYDGLTQAQKEKVTEAALEKLVAAEAEINSLKDEAVQVESVINKINDLPTTITLSDEATVVSARDAYDGLTQAQKEKVTEAALEKLVAAEAEINSLKDEVVQVDSVINKINTLPTTITLSDEAAVVSAREAYDGLTQAQKEKVTEAVLEKLVAAEAEINNLKDEASLIDSVINKINALPTTITLADEIAVVSARQAYDGLTQVQKEKVTETVLEKLVAAEAEINNLKDEASLIDSVINKINALPTTITLADEIAVVSARQAYDGLTQVQKGKVSTSVLNKLVAAENKIITLKNQAKANEVQNKINALPSQIKLTNESAVVAVRAAYNGLTVAQKGYVSSTALNKLVSAEKTIVNLKNAAKAVKDKIAALPTTSQVRLASEAVIKSARTAYNSLDSSQKSLVGSITRLTSAEARLAVIKADKTLPTIKGVSNNAYYRTKKTIQISDNVGLLNVKLTFNGKAYTYYSGKVFAASGKYNIIATDLKGNKRSMVFYIDNKAPLKPAVKSITSSTTKVTGKAEANSTVYIYRGSKKIASSKVSSSGTYSVKISKQKKRTKLTIYAVDRAGNKGAKTIVTVK